MYSVDPLITQQVGQTEIGANSARWTWNFSLLHHFRLFSTFVPTESHCVRTGRDSYWTTVRHANLAQNWTMPGFGGCTHLPQPQRKNTVVTLNIFTRTSYSTFRYYYVRFYCCSVPYDSRRTAGTVVPGDGSKIGSNANKRQQPKLGLPQDVCRQHASRI